jgi:hypothetical protein
LNPPVIDPRDQAGVLAGLVTDLPGYTPEWSASTGKTGVTLMRILARYAGVLIGGLNQLPQRELLAFLDMLGTHLLPAQAAQAPLVFSLVENSPVDVTLPKYSQVAAPPPPVVPTLSSRPSTTASTSGAPQPLIFATLEAITLSRGHLASLYSIDPGSDEYADHSASLISGFTLFDNMILTEHAIYLGHDSLFAFNGSIYLLLLIGLRAGAGAPLTIQWEYLAQNGWVPLSSLPQDDTTGGLQNDGTIILQRECGPPAKQDTFAGKTSYWVRGKLASPLLPDGTKGKRTVPVINTIHARLKLSKSDLSPEAAFADTVSLDVSKDFYPFGQQPTRFSTFYLASKEVFQRRGASVQITLTLTQPGVVQGALTLEWDYFNGSAWNDLGLTYLFTDKGSVTFQCPRDWQQNTVNGVKNYWLRVWIKSGSYGCPLRLNLPPVAKIIDVSSDGRTLTVDSNDGYCGGEQVILTDSSGGNPSNDYSIEQSLFVPYNPDGTANQNPDQLVLASAVPPPVAKYIPGKVIPPPGLPLLAAPSLQPPVVHTMILSYTYLTDPELPDYCLSKNDFVFEDHTHASHWPDQTFTPFHPVADVQPAVHFGFDKPLPAGLVSLYADIPQPAAQSGTAGASAFVWEYLSVNGWNELGVLDETQGFQRSGMIQFAGQPDAIAAPGLHGDPVQLYWIRARLKQGEQFSTAAISGMWLNAVWASQRTSNATELAGTSDGNPGQTFLLQHKPVLAGEKIEVQEWTGRGDGWQTALADVPQSDLRSAKDAATGLVTAVWVHWYEQPNLYNSGPGDRHYIIERGTGFIRFGPPGMIPPAGSQISAAYSSGGGVAGNVPAGSIAQLHTAAPYVMKVANPIAASGGTDTETTDSVVARGPQAIRNRDRAISPSDYEWLARQASPDVGRARCVSITGPDGHAQRGWVTLVLAPRSLDPQPQPTPEFQVRILDYISARAPFSAASQIRIVGPQYSPVGVWMEVVPKDVGQAAQLEAQLRDRLNQFLHPLSGGPLGQGWDFGQPVYISQIADVIEAIPGVNYVPGILLKVNGQVFDDFVPVDPGSLVAAGTHEIKLAIA